MMTARQMAGKVHLWLGLASGLVVFIVAVTGCLYVFEKEVQDLFHHDIRFAEQQPATDLAAPSDVLASARAATGTPNPFYYDYTAKPAQTLLAGSNEVRTHQVWSQRPNGDWMGAYVHPYTGEVLTTWNHDEGWLELIEGLHAHLLLPEAIGRPIVGAATLIFVVLLLTGLWLWFPLRIKAFGSERGRRPLFKVTWKHGGKRLNYDLHNVVGFYSTLALLIIALTGLVWSYSWVESGIYWAASGGEWPEAEHAHPESTLPPNWQRAEAMSVDAIYQRVRREYPGLEKYGVIPASDSAGAIEIILDRDEMNYSGSSELYFDQYTGELLEAERFEEMNAGAQLRQMNYDLHAGVIWGFPTKVLAFFASFVAATLPVTGFLVWWPKWRRKQRRKRRGEDAQARPYGVVPGSAEEAAWAASGDGHEAEPPAVRPVRVPWEEKEEA